MRGPRIGVQALRPAIVGSLRAVCYFRQTILGWPRSLPIKRLTAYFHLYSQRAYWTSGAAPPGQGGEGHFNEQPRSYWIAKLDTRGYRLHEEWTDELRAVKEFYSDNMMVFTRRRIGNGYG